MLKSKIFMKKTKRGKILKIVREHYLRDDVWSGTPLIPLSDLAPAGEPPPTSGASSLQQNPKNLGRSKLCPAPHYLIPDTNLLLHQIDVLEHESINNVIILQTVLHEVKHRSPSVYKRVKDILGTSDKHFYTFVNEFHKDTYVERQPGESANDRNDRAIRTAALWYKMHLFLNQEESKNNSVQVVLLTNDKENARKAKKDEIITFTIHEYVRTLTNSEELIDLLASENDGLSFHSNKPVFAEHLPLSEIQKGLKSGRYSQGSFQTSRDNYLEAYVSVPDLEERVLIQGHQNMNRAVNEDVVAIELLPKSEWTCPSSLILVDEGEKGDDGIDMEDSAVKEKEIPDELKQPTGRVVGVIKRNWRQYCGIIQRSLIKGANKHLFIPAEKKIPKIRIETRQVDILEGCRIIVVIDSWPRQSRYPLGHFVRKLGNIGDKDAENEVLLLEHDVPHNSWSEAVLDCLPKLPWQITPEDEKKRVDLRHVDICSVDPPGCTDIDDALHCKALPNGNYEVGVHIADVSHFIRPGTALDQESSNRGTTVYLIDKRIDMVPELLSSNLCSLRGGVERFAFSCIWEMTPKANIIATKYHKSIIKSKAALTYAEAQMRIDDERLNDGVTQGLRKLNVLAKILKRQRITNGALTLASQEVRFHIDSETHDPIDVQQKELRDTNSMVEEFMLLANMSVAEKILEEFPDCALLRRHPSPPASNYDPIIKAAKDKGFTLEVSTGKKLADSLDLATISSNPYFNTMLRILATRCMMQAVYFCSGMIPKTDYFHYGLAAEIYTHFTSPIRRYSDLMVHRLLAVSIGADASYPDLLEKKKLNGMCNNLNFRHRMAQYAGRASVGLHTQIYFKNRVIDEQGYVLFVRKNALQILIPKFGLEGTIFLTKDKTEGVTFVYDEEKGTQSCGNITLRIFDPVTVQISIDATNIQHQKLKLKLVKPVIPNFSVEPQEIADAGPAKKKLKT